jgi:FkbM family methyltransferase
MPKVSICIPTFNHPELVRRTLDSILAQNLEDYEVIITDDSDGDAVKEQASSFDDKRIQYYKNVRQLGSPANWNRAISLAKGEYIKVIHHDDWFHDKNCLLKFVKLLDEHPESVLGFSSAYACQSDGTVAYVHAPTTTQLEELQVNPANLIFSNYIGAPSATIFRNKEHGLFDENLKWLVDIDFYITLLSSANKSYSYIAEPLICIAIEGDHKVTNECSGNQDVELFEHVLLFNKIQKMPCKPSPLKYLKFLSLLLSRFNISSAAEFRQVAKVQKIPGLQRLALMLGMSIRSLQNLKQLAKGWLNQFRSERFRPKISYSQCGEDLIVDFIFMWIGRKNITYLDIGTNDPIKLNNTYFFYKKHCRGVLVEPDPRLFRKIKRRRSGDICLNAGVGTGAGSDITFYLMQPDTLSTSSPEKAKEYIKLGVKLKSEFKVPLININAVIENHFGSLAPDYLSVDVEGLDFEIIKSLDLSKYRPVAICAETLTYTNNNSEKKIEEISKYLCGNGYFIYADTYINTIFVDMGVWNKRKVN